MLNTELIKPGWASQIGRDSKGLWIEFEQLGNTCRVYLPQWEGELGYDNAGLYYRSYNQRRLLSAAAGFRPEFFAWVRHHQKKSAMITKTNIKLPFLKDFGLQIQLVLKLCGRL